MRLLHRDAEPRVIKQAGERAYDAQYRMARPTANGNAGQWATAKDMGSRLAQGERPAMDGNRRP